MRVTFVHPAGYNFKLGKRDVTQLVNRMAPTGILQLAAVLEAQGHTTSIHDCLGPFAPNNLSSNVDSILRTRPDIVAFSATTSAFLDGYDMAVEIKHRRPDLRIIFGGSHVSSAGSPLLSSFPEIDYLCIGEGEGCMSDLAAGHSPESIPNLALRRGESVIANPRRPRVANLDDLPFPAYGKLAGFPHKYHLPLFSFVKRCGATLVTSRGCPYACSFCDRTVFRQQYRCNSPEYVWEHMRYLREHFQVRHVNFYDDLFTANPHRILALCALLLKKPLGMDFNCAIRADHCDPELLRSLKQAGCVQVSVGVESGDPHLLSLHKAGVTPDAIRNTVHTARGIGLRVKGLFIFGLPGETPQSVQATSDFIESTPFDEINISKFSPFFGAPAWDECASGKSGTLQQDWRFMNCLHFTFLPAAFQSFNEMEFLYNECISRFYQGKHYQRLLWRRLWEHRWSLWHVLSHLPAFLYAWSQFKPRRKLRSQTHEWPALHPAQPSLTIWPSGTPKITPRAVTQVTFSIDIPKGPAKTPLVCSQSVSSPR